MHEVESIAPRLADAARALGARDIEIAQGDMAQRQRARRLRRGLDIPQHPLGHEFRAAVGVDGAGRVVFPGASAVGDAVDRRRGGEHELRDAVGGAGREQRACTGGVVAVIFERVAHGLRDAERSGEMQHGVHVVLAQHAADERGVSDIAQHERGIEHGLAEAGTEVVEHHHALAQLQHRVAADVARAAGDEDALRKLCDRFHAPIVVRLHAKVRDGRDLRRATLRATLPR